MSNSGQIPPETGSSSLPFCSSLRLLFWPLKPRGDTEARTHPLPWKPAHAFWSRLTPSNKRKTSKQNEAQCIPQSQPRADWQRRATRSVYNYSSGIIEANQPAKRIRTSRLRACKALKALVYHEACSNNNVLQRSGTEHLGDFKPQMIQMLNLSLFLSRLLTLSLSLPLSAESLEARTPVQTVPVPTATSFNRALGVTFFRFFGFFRFLNFPCHNVTQCVTMQRQKQAPVLKTVEKCRAHAIA